MTTKTTLLAWHGDPELRERIVARMREHHAANTFVQGVYQRLDQDAVLNYRGCAIGCLLDKQEFEGELGATWHRRVERQFGIPARLAALIDGIFEALDADAAPGFALAVTEALPVGADLGGVFDWFMVLTLEEGEVRDLYEGRLWRDEDPDHAAWLAAEDAVDFWSSSYDAAVFERDGTASDLTQVVMAAGRDSCAHRLVELIASAGKP